MRGLDLSSLPGKLEKGFPRRSLAAYILIAGLYLLFDYSAQVVFVYLSGNPPASLEVYTTLELAALEFGLMIPLKIVGALLLWRRRAVGYVITTLLIVTASLTFLSPGVSHLLMYFSYQRSGISDIVELVVFAAVSIGFTAIIFKRMEEKKMSGRNKITRRRFLGLLGGAVGAAALGCCGLTVLGARQPGIELQRSSCGGEAMSKVLVAYATKAGSTGEVAEAIGQALCAGGAVVDVKPVKEVSDVSGYSGVVVGSAIRMGRWLPEAVGFVEVHEAALATMPVAYFQVSGFLKEDTPENRQEAATYLDSVRALVEPASIGLFAGKMDYSKLSFFDRTIAKMVGSVEGDWRDWDAIRSWAGDLLTLGFTTSA